MRGIVEIEKTEFDKLSEEQSSLLVKSMIGRFMKMNPPDKHHIRPYATRHFGNKQQFLFDSEIAYKTKQMERTGKIVGWKRNHEQDNWKLLI